MCIVKGFLSFWSVGMNPSGTGSRSPERVLILSLSESGNHHIEDGVPTSTPGVPVINEVKGISVMAMASPCKQKKMPTHEVCHSCSQWHAVSGGRR